MWTRIYNQISPANQWHLKREGREGCYTIKETYDMVSNLTCRPYRILIKKETVSKRAFLKMTRELKYGLGIKQYNQVIVIIL